MVKEREAASTSSICRKSIEENLFDKVFYEGPKGQPGVFVELRRGEFEALLRRECTPFSVGYNGSLKNPTRITYLSISSPEKDYGCYDPKEHVHSPKHKFEKDAEKNPELGKFLEDILRNFN
jgi:hypothetical protein